jgi:hypothetical protein
MIRASLAPVALLGVFAACPDNAPKGNAPILWLAPYMSETRVQLVDSEPPAY